MYRFLLVYFGFILGIKHIEGVNEITTIYKFTPTQSDTEDVKYLNICTVAVHVEDNPLQLPLFNINGDSSLPESTIPPLYTEQGTSTWKKVMTNGARQDLPVIRPSKTYLSEFFESAFNAEIHNINKYYTKSVSNNGYVFNDLWRQDNDRIILQVIFQEGTRLRVQIKWGCTNDGSRGITITIKKSGSIKICYDVIGAVDYCPYTVDYSTNYIGYGQIEIDLTDNLKIIDQVSSNTYEFFIRAIQGCNLFSIRQDYDSYFFSYGNNVLYKLKSQNEMTLVSPWLDIKNNQSLFILHSKQRDSNLKVLLEDENRPGNPIQLDCKVINHVDIFVSLETVLTKVTLTFPLNWDGQKRIKLVGDGEAIYISNVWEGRSLDLYKIEDPQPCMKFDGRDIYNIPPLENRPRTKEERLPFCLNGGRWVPINNADFFACSCPPGFVGNSCEIPCGRNLFGASCMKNCSESSNECQGIVLCTPEYGCSCAPGYQGNYCSEQCQSGFYGADCKQRCGDCKDGCDIYTGNCHGGCNSNYLTRPQCKRSHSYILSSGQVLGSNFNQINLQIDFTQNNINKSNDNTMFYMLQYREETESIWSNSTYEIFNEGINSNITVEGLKPGHIYQIRTILIDETLETHDPVLTKPVKGETKCTIIYKGNLQTSNITNTSVSVSWNKENDLAPTECPAMGFILETYGIGNDYVKKERIPIIIGENSYTVKNLSPSRTYQINLKILKSAGDGESVPIFGTKVTTTDTIDFTKDIMGVTLLKNKSSVNIKWFPNPIYKLYYIKYKLKRHLSCYIEETVFPLQVTNTSLTSYNLNLNDLEANSQYELFVTADINQIMNPNNKSFITYSRVPNAIPTLLQDRLKINSESAQLHWTHFSLSCQNMNGIFKSYRIELYNTQNLTENVYRTSDNHITISGLTPETKYEVRIRFVNQVGSSLFYLELSFQTKKTPVFLIQDFTAYKTGLNLIGLRWKYVDTNLTNISGININLQTVIWNKTITLSDDLKSFQCKAWPGFMCFDVTELMSNTKYAIKMEKFPEGSESKTIHVITKENSPFPVSDIQAEYTNTSMIISWRIPNILNGILRNFVIELEHLSSFDETMCCEDLLVVNYTVSMEQEKYSYTMPNIKPASSYQISIRPFTKRSGATTSEMIDTPPSLIPLQMKPEFYLDNVDIQFKEEDQMSSEYENNELISETLIIVEEANTDTHVTRHLTDRFTTDISRILASNTWWLTQVCAANDDNCTVDLNVNKYQNSTVPYYGQVVKKPLERNHRYRIVVAQVNNYLSARSYTVKTSEYFTLE